MTDFRPVGPGAGPLPKSSRAPGVSKGESAIAFPPSASAPIAATTLAVLAGSGSVWGFRVWNRGPIRGTFLSLPALLPEESADLPIAVLEEGELDIPLGRSEAFIGVRQELLVGETIHDGHQMTSIGRERQHLIVRDLIAPRVAVEFVLGRLSAAGRFEGGDDG